MTWAAMWNFSSEVLIIVVRSAIVYVALILLMRLAGKRAVGQLTLFDLVILLLISNAVQSAMTGPDQTVDGGIIAAFTLVVLNSGLAALTMRYPRLASLVQGSAVTLIQQGEVLTQNLKHERVSEAELMAVLREHEVTDPANVDLATLELDGTISVIRRADNGATFTVRTRKRLSRHAERPNLG